MALKEITIVPTDEQILEMWRICKKCGLYEGKTFDEFKELYSKPTKARFG